MGAKKIKKTNFNIYLLLPVIFCFLLFFIVTYLDTSGALVYPSLHRNQPNPKRYIERRKEISSIILPTPELIEHGNRNKKEVALTFDADMTYSMLDMLKRGEVDNWFNKGLKEYLDTEKVKATIFMTGLWAEAYPQAAREIGQSYLYEIGNHSYSHPAFAPECYGLPFIDNGKNGDEVDRAQKTIFKITGILPKFFRFPGGCYEKIDITTISRYGMPVIHWDVVANDGFNYDVQNIAYNIESKVQNGSIIVMHFNGSLYAPKTLEAIKQVVPDLKKRGFKFVTVSEIITE